MKKAVIVCILVAVLACVWANVACASIGKYPNVPADEYSDAFKQNFVIVKSKSIAETNAYGTMLFVFENPVYKAYNGLKTAYKAVYYTTWNGTAWSGRSYFQPSTDYANITDSFWTKYDIVYSTIPIYTDNTFTDIAYSANYVWRPFGAPTVNIVLPFDGYMDNSWLYSLSIITTFPDIQTGFDPTLLTVQVRQNGQPFGDLYKRVVSNRVYEKDGSWINQLNLDVELPVGENTVSVEYWLGEDMLASDTVNIERLSGFVDEDGDGKDDRTGQSDSSQKPIYKLETEMPQKPEDGDLLAWVQYVGELLSYIFEVVMSAIKEFANSVFDGMETILQIVEPMFSFVSQFFASMPSPISSAIIALVTVSAVFGILKILRG